MDQQTVLKHSGLGIASFVISIVAFVLTIATFGVGGVLKVTGATNPAVDVGLGFAMMLIWLAAVVGIGLGVAGALDKKSHKTFPVVGLVINIGIIVISAILVFVGIQMES